MRTPYNFQMSDNCQTCAFRTTGYFCQFPIDVIRDFDAIRTISFYPRGSILFVENENPRGIFVLCKGQVKLSVSSSDGKTVMLRIVNPGAVLGLTATLGGTRCEANAETLRPSQIAFVERDDLLSFIADHPMVYQNVVEHMASSYQAVCDQLRSVIMPSSQKLARILLDWSTSGPRIMLPLTHEEIGNYIGTTRETVSRTFMNFKSRNLITTNGAAVTIRDRKALEDICAPSSLNATAQRTFVTDSALPKHPRCKEIQHSTD